ncbi:EAL domain-containing protein [Marinobacter sp. C2H3]|uniref:EAL domain-containing protein n=1 Tax=Marinobacter sp. C2H3 TaxID=3119003 RepID=UPI00300EF22E
MDSPRTARLLTATHAWLPLALLLVGFAYILGVTNWPGGTAVAGHGLYPTHAAASASPSPVQLLPDLAYQMQPLDSVLATPAAEHSDAWTRIDPSHSGLGFPYRPVTYRIHLSNTDTVSRRQHLVVTAPFLDVLRPVLITPDGQRQFLPVLGDRSGTPRLVDLPDWVWPITVPPGRSTLMMEVRNNGATVLPLALGDNTSPGAGTVIGLVWKMLITGLLAFALLLTLSAAARLGSLGLGWLSVFLTGVILSQLIMDGIGYWLLWPGLPALNTLIGACLPLCLVALCEFTILFLDTGSRGARLLRGFSILAGVHLLAAPFGLDWLGQHSLLVLCAITGTVILGLLVHHRDKPNAGALALAILVILVGAMLSSARVVGLFPVNPFTDSAYFLGAALGSLILTSGVARSVIQERKRQQRSDERFREERRLRARVEKDVDRLLKTNRITGKPNRVMFEEALSERERPEQPFAICMIRLSRINELQQVLGYRTTETLLKQYLRHLNTFIRRTLGDRLIPINGFAVASLDLANHAFAYRRDDSDQPDDGRALESVTRWLRAQFREGRFSFSWGPTVGVAYAPEHGVTVPELVSSAGFASLADGDGITVYDPAIAEHQYRQQILMLELEGSLRKRELWLEYQPKVRIADGEVMSLEALARWRHPEFGQIPPDQWIPVAEQVGLIPKVTNWVLAQACQDYHRLAERFGPDVAVAVNVSATDLARPDFVAFVAGTVASHGLAPDRLILEITETAVMADPALAACTLARLSETGVRLSLDDFGTGQSSLGMLAGFRLDELKIDRSLLQGILDDERRRTVLRMALDLGTTLNLKVVVEGVEDNATAQWLTQFPGLFGQGYYWGRPAPLATLTRDR